MHLKNMMNLSRNRLVKANTCLDYPNRLQAISSSNIYVNACPRQFVMPLQFPIKPQLQKQSTSPILQSKKLKPQNSQAKQISELIMIQTKQHSEGTTEYLNNKRFLSKKLVGVKVQKQKNHV